MQRVIYDLQADKREMNDKIEKLKNEKAKYEKMLKKFAAKSESNPNEELLG